MTGKAHCIEVSLLFIYDVIVIEKCESMKKIIWWLRKLFCCCSTLNVDKISVWKTEDIDSTLRIKYIWLLYLFVIKPKPHYLNFKNRKFDMFELCKVFRRKKHCWIFYSDGKSNNMLNWILSKRHTTLCCIGNIIIIFQNYLHAGQSTSPKLATTVEITVSH